MRKKNTVFCRGVLRKLKKLPDFLNIDRKRLAKERIALSQKAHPAGGILLHPLSPSPKVGFVGLQSFYPLVKLGRGAW
jgi:hypothetical protein